MVAVGFTTEFKKHEWSMVLQRPLGSVKYSKIVTFRINFNKLCGYVATYHGVYGSA